MHVCVCVCMQKKSEKSHQQLLSKLPLRKACTNANTSTPVADKMLRFKEHKNLSTFNGCLLCCHVVFVVFLRGVEQDDALSALHCS